MANWNNGQAASSNGDAAMMQHWNRPKLWDYLVAEKLLRVMVVVAGVGPHAAGMPELDLSFRCARRFPGISGRVGYGRPRRRSPTTESPSVTSFPRRWMAGRSVPFGRATGSIWIWLTGNSRSCGS